MPESRTGQVGRSDQRSENARARLPVPSAFWPLRRKRSAELTLNERHDGSTGCARQLPVFGLDEHPDHRLGARRTDEYAAVLAELAVVAFDLGDDRRRQLLRRDADVLLALRDSASCSAAASLSRRPRSAAQRSIAAARPSPVTWSREVDHVARLLAAEQAALALQRLEDVTVADVGRDRRGCRARRIRAWKPRFVICVTATRSTPRSSARIATIPSPSTSSPLLVDREHPVAVAVEGDPEVEAAASTPSCGARPCRSRRSRR